eukprot:UN32313
MNLNDLDNSLSHFHRISTKPRISCVSMGSSIDFFDLDEEQIRVDPWKNLISAELTSDHKSVPKKYHGIYNKLEEKEDTETPVDSEGYPVWRNKGGCYLYKPYPGPNETRSSSRWFVITENFYGWGNLG